MRCNAKEEGCTHNDFLRRAGQRSSGVYTNWIMLPLQQAQQKNRIPGNGTYLHFYNDGSILDGKVGFGLYGEDLEPRFGNHRLPETSIVYQAEVISITEVAKWLIGNVVTNTGVIIYSDSQVAIRSLEAIFLNSRTSLHCSRFSGSQGIGIFQGTAKLSNLLAWGRHHTFYRNLLIFLRPFPQANFQVPENRNIPGNFKADEVVRMGTTLKTVEEFDNIGTSLPHANFGLVKRQIGY